MRFYPYVYLLVILIYIAGRTGMVALITGSDEYKRYINFQILPRNITRESVSAFQKEERTAKHIRYKIFQFYNFKNTYTVKFSFPQNTFRYFYDSYEGSYLDPPDIA